MFRLFLVGKRLIFASALLFASFAVVPGSPVIAANSSGSTIEVGDMTIYTPATSTSAVDPQSSSVLTQDQTTLTTQDQTTPFTPKQQALADRLYTQYAKLRGNTYGLRFLFDQASGYRRAYLSFMYGEQFHKRDTTILEGGLNLFDTFIQDAKNNQQKGLVDLGYPNGLDASGKNVVNINTVSREILAGLPDFLSARAETTTAIFFMHSALNLYSQVTGLAVPNVPKLRLPPFCLACTTTQ